MITYLKNMEGWKHKDLKSKDFDSIKELFDKAFKRVNKFVDFRTNLVEGSSKRAGEELEQESTKKQKVDEDKNIAELQTTKPLTIVDWKIHKEGKNSYFQIIRVDGSSKMYLVFSQLLKSVDREDLVALYKLGDLKTMFEPYVEDEIWKLQQRYKVLSWKLFDSCGVHCLSLQSGMIYMLVEKRYPLTPPTITDMLNNKLQGRIVRIKSLLNAASITAAHIVMLMLLSQRAAYEWFTRECIGSITTWDNMLEKFVLKFHHLSDHNKEETEEDGDPNETNNVPEIFRIEGNLFDFETPLWYDKLADGKLKDETLALMAKIEGSWGDATP
ncbi:hypothetical protein Tco_0854700 [Tanacetum coccineum]